MKNAMILPPKVSIIIPVYNGSNYLREAIDSALAQTYSNIEVIVVNDGSDDHGATKFIAMSYGSKIRYFEKPNGGVSSALNFGVEKMTGDYFCWLSHDDLYKPDKVKRQIEFLQINGFSYDTILYGGYELINEKSEVIGAVDFTKLYPREQLDIPLFPVFRGLANGCTMLIHKSHFERVGMFNEKLRTTQDYDLWFRMFRGANVKFCPGIYVRSRLHPKQTSRTTNEHTSECNQLWIKMINDVTTEEMCAMEGSAYYFYIRTAEFLRKHSDYDEAVNYIRVLAQKELEKNGGNIHLRKHINSTPFVMSSIRPIHLLRRFLFNVRYEGVRITIKKLVNKFKKTKY